MSEDRTGETVEGRAVAVSNIADRAGNCDDVCHNSLKSAMRFDVVENPVLGV